MLKEVHLLFLEKENLNEDEKSLFEYAEIFIEIRRIRNETAHSIGKESDILKDIEKLKNYSNNIIELLKNENIIQNAKNKLKILENLKITMKINL